MMKLELTLNRTAWMDGPEGVDLQVSEFTNFEIRYKITYTSTFACLPTHYIPPSKK